MTNQTKSVKKKYSLYWLITVLSFLVTGVLIWNNSINKGPLISLSMDNAEGIEPYKTLVKYRSVNIGMVENVYLNDDYSKTIVETRIYPSYEDLLRKDSMFWIVEPRVELKQISGLSTLFSGSYIQVYKGKEAEKSVNFECLKDVPILIDEDTVSIVLHSQAEKLFDTSTYINYNGMEVGQIAGHTFDPETKHVTYTAKIRKSFASLVNSKSVFWADPGVYVNFGPQGFNFSIPSFDNLVIGSINIDTFDKSESRPLEEGMEFTLYQDVNYAKASMLENKPKYVIMVKQNTQDLAAGGAVMFRNSKIGEILKIPYFEKPLDLYDLKKPIPVLFVLDSDLNDEDQQKVKKIFDDHLKDGSLCASVGLTNMVLTTGDIIKLEIDPKKKCKTDVKSYRNYAVIPLIEYESALDSVQKFASNLGNMDLAGISDKLNTTLSSMNETVSSLNRIVSAVESKNTVDKLNKTIVSYDSDSEVYRSLIAVISKLNKSISDLDPTIKKLGQKSNALVFSTTDRDVEPKVSGKK